MRNLLDDDEEEDDEHLVDSLYHDTKETALATSSSPLGHAPLSYGQSSNLCYPIRYDCAPGLILSDSEDSSFASCGADEFFDLEEISSHLNLIENWQKLNRRVRFGSARVREYGITVGDHPICRDGLALSLDWCHAKEKVYDIDDYELLTRQRESQRKGIRRRRRVSKLDYWQRREILTSVGSFTNADLARMERRRNQEAVREFLLDFDSDYDDTDDYGPSVEQGLEMEPADEGIELEEVYGDSNHQSYFKRSGASGWQMNVQILE